MNISTYCIIGLYEFYLGSSEYLFDYKTLNISTVFEISINNYNKIINEYK